MIIYWYFLRWIWSNAGALWITLIIQKLFELAQAYERSHMSSSKPEQTENIKELHTNQKYSLMTLITFILCNPDSMDLTTSCRCYTHSPSQILSIADDVPLKWIWHFICIMHCRLNSAYYIRLALLLVGIHAQYGTQLTISQYQESGKNVNSLYV